MPAPKGKDNRPYDTLQIGRAKEIILKHLAKGWSVAYACQKAHISRMTEHTWLTLDPAYAEARSQARELDGGDFYEDKLRDRVVQGDTTATIVALKMRGRFRDIPSDPEQIAQAILASMRQIVAAQKAALAEPSPSDTLPAPSSAVSEVTSST